MINPFSHKTRNAIQNARVSQWLSNFKLTKREIFQICKLHTKMFYNFGIMTNCPAWLWHSTPFHTKHGMRFKMQEFLNGHQISNWPKEKYFKFVSYTPKCFITLVLGLIVQLGFDDQSLFTQNTECDSKCKSFSMVIKYQIDQKRNISNL